ncbi:uncharacterized protein LOC129598639 isoform X2 [Paramacrobiotus metropolitanus]|uniref:uncharacterized protein LOC129598639 isoform X2 n=1 Tax=Paramacrobiotus metropolitanus TaxID=2943436 RepID=UPI002445AE96|nr:uncharacterized protein LOC129598639 isoform X2 [Paramacrobiotus metropolitanus]
MLYYCQYKIERRSVYPAFRRRLAGRDFISYQNTVVVQMAKDMCWLGFIQDINGDKVLVDFDSSTVPARNIPASRVWPLQLVSSEGVEYENMSAFAALRDEQDGPFRFRPVSVLSFVKDCKMFFISTDSLPASDTAPVTQISVVDRCQIVSRLPFGEPLLLARTSGILYTRLEFPFATSQLVVESATEATRFIDTFRQLYTSHPSLSDMEDSCRFHLRIGSDQCTFIVVGSQTDSATIQWTAEILRNILDQHATCRASVPMALVAQTAECSEESDEMMAKDTGTTCTAGCLCHLPLVLVTEILEFLDLHTQARAMRVCALWQLILTNPHATHHISILTENLTPTPYGEHQCCRTAGVLLRSITRHTKSVTITARAHDWDAELFDWHCARLVQKLLKVSDIKLPFLVLKSFCLTYVVPAVLQVFEPVCEQLIVRGWKLCGALLGVMRSDVDALMTPCTPLPDHEERFISTASPENPQSVLNGTLTIPHLACVWRDGREHISRAFMCALDRSFPPATPDVFAKVAAVRTRWRNTLVYPEEWQSIRHFLSMYSGFWPDGSPHAWDDVDLRSVDLDQLSTLALWGIYEIFNV